MPRFISAILIFIDYALWNMFMRKEHGSVTYAQCIEEHQRFFPKIRRD